jgi:predicted kinase
MLKSRVKYTFGVTFGKKEYFDDHGNLINVEDRDAQYENVRIKREDVLEILRKAGVFNLETGKHSIIDTWTNRSDRMTNPLKTDGSFYRLLENYITFRFEPAEIEDGKEIRTPM